MKTFLLFLLLLLSSSSLYGIIGETVEECTRRYGEPTFLLHNKKVAHFSNNGFEIKAIYKEGLCTSIIFRKESLSKKEMEELLKLNSQGREWIELDDGVWVTRDGVLYGANSLQPHYMSIVYNKIKKKKDN